MPFSQDSWISSALFQLHLHPMPTQTSTLLSHTNNTDINLNRRKHLLEEAACDALIADYIQLTNLWLRTIKWRWVWGSGEWAGGWASVWGVDSFIGVVIAISFEFPMKAEAKLGVREKEKKIKPIKQPSKAARPPILLDKVTKQDDSLPRGEREKQGKSMAASVPAAEEHKNSSRESICAHLLQSGNVQSFIDLFYISHKCLPNLMDKKNYFGERLHIPDLQPEEESTLQFYSDFANSLAKAEVRPDSSRDQKEAAMNEYNSIAFNYEDQGDFVTASYFYQKVIDLAASCKNRQYELIALLGLGKCHDQGRKRDQAIEILEDAFDSASTLDSKEQRTEMVRLIGKELIEIYIEKAEELVKIDLAYALKAFESGLVVAQRASERESEARISHKIGELYYLEGQFERSVQYQEQYLARLKQSIEDELIREAEDGIEKKDSQNSLKFKEMEAHASLAKCYLKLKSIEQAELHLNDYHRMAKQAKAQNSVADSSYYLAKLFEEKGEKEKAIGYYQSYFEAAKSEKPDKKDRKLVDKARVTYAIAKANKNMEKYIGLFEGENSLRNVLDWKIKRVLK